MGQEKFQPPLRLISVLVGLMVGFILSYAYQVNLPTLIYEMNPAFLLASAVVYVSVPLMAGFVTALLQPEMALKNSILVGLVSGLFNSVVATIKLIYAPAIKPGELYAFAVFAVMSVFVWVVLAMLAALLATKIFE